MTVCCLLFKMGVFVYVLGVLFGLRGWWSVDSGECSWRVWLVKFVAGLLLFNSVGYTILCLVWVVFDFCECLVCGYLDYCLLFGWLIVALDACRVMVCHYCLIWLIVWWCLVVAFCCAFVCCALLVGGFVM